MDEQKAEEKAAKQAAKEARKAARKKVKLEAQGLPVPPEIAALAEGAVPETEAEAAQRKTDEAAEAAEEAIVRQKQNEAAIKAGGPGMHYSFVSDV